jgi:transposase-like protein
VSATRCPVPKCGGISQADPTLWEGQILHGSATTPHAIRAAIQRSKAPLKELAGQYGLNHKTVAKWRKRAFVNDAPMGPKLPRSTVLSPEEEPIVVAFCKHTLLPLDDCLYALQATIPHLTRSSLHRCLKRHGISRLPEIAGDTVPKKPFKSYRSATSTSTSPRFVPARVSSTSSWRSIAHRSLPSPSYTRLPT